MAIKLFWWQEKRKDGRENYGDLMSKYIVEKISNKKVSTVPHPSKFLYKYFFKHYISIGSIISSTNKNSIVWGSGIIKKDDLIGGGKFIAVRGPKTRERILNLGFSCPEIYGDPALILPNLYNPLVSKKYKIGIIPHYVDYKLVTEQLKNESDIVIIDLLTHSVEQTTKLILQCDCIISSSLHGVIVAHAYKIPALWIKFSNKLFGDDIKFYDYFESVGLKYEKELYLEPHNISIRMLESYLNDNKNILLANEELLNLRKEQLIQSCPF